jgi:hypothetical protein
MVLALESDTCGLRKARPGDGGGGAGKLYTWRALQILRLEVDSGACLHPPNRNAPSLGPRGLAAPRPRTQPGRGRDGGSGQPAPLGIRHPSCARARGRPGTGRSVARGAWIEVSRPWAGVGEGNSGRPGIPNPGGGGARARPGRRSQGEGVPRPQTRGAGVAQAPAGGGPSPEP